jgi:hypothetical protein
MLTEDSRHCNEINNIFVLNMIISIKVIVCFGYDICFHTVQRIHIHFPPFLS